MAAPLRANGPRDHLLRVLLDHDEAGVLTVRPLADQDSSLVTVFAQADGLMRRPAGSAAAPEGALVDVLRLGRL
jgi:molybdopterin molybdotransferase